MTYANSIIEDTTDYIGKRVRFIRQVWDSEEECYREAENTGYIYRLSVKAAYNGKGNYQFGNLVVSFDISSDPEPFKGWSYKDIPAKNILDEVK